MRSTGYGSRTLRRSSLRFLTELFIVGVLPSLDPVVAILTRMMKEDDTKRDFANLSGREALDVKEQVEEQMEGMEMEEPQRLVAEACARMGQPVEKAVRPVPCLRPRLA